MTMHSDPEHELLEANAELARHHRDFAQISAIVDKTLAKSGLPHGFFLALEALKEIRKIVG